MKYQKPSQNMSSTSNQPGRINFQAKKYKLPYVWQRNHKWFT